MSALTKDRNTPTRDGKLIAIPAAANKKFYVGAIACVNGGLATPGVDAVNTLKVAGRVEGYLDTTGLSNGAASVLVRRGVFKFDNAGDIAQANTFGTAYIADDQTVTASSNNGTRSAAGKIIAIDDDGVWVEIT